MSEYSEYFLNSHSNVVLLELIEISHVNFSQVYRIVRNSMQGITVALETSEVAAFIYVPMKITPNSTYDDLDCSYKFEFGDLGDILVTELDNVISANGLNIKPTILYRAYRSDDLTAPLYGPINLEISSIDFTKTGATFEAKAPTLNAVRTGEIYSLNKFPMLRGCL